MKLKVLTASILLALNTAHAQTINAESSETKFLAQTGVTQAWLRGITGQSVRIGIIDNGFDLTHADLRGQVIAARSFTTTTVTWGSHGTAMASIAAGARSGSGTIGVAPDAGLLLAQAGTGGTNLELNPTAVKNALGWLSTQNVAVINMSFGAAYPTSFTSRVRYDSLTRSYIGPAQDSSIADFKVATDRGAILVTAAGNQGLPYSQAPAIYSVQTDVSGRLVLSGRSLIVGAVDASNQIASYSNRAGHLCQNVSGNVCRDTVPTMYYYVVAPGSGLQAATANQLGRGINTAYPVSGTSGAAAYVSGGIALMRQAWPTLAPERIINIVLNTARDLGTAGVDTTYGRGLVDFDAATRPAGSLLVANRMPLGSSSTGAALASTAVTGGIGLRLTSTSLLTRTQVVDEYARNYTADLTAAYRPHVAIYDPVNPFLAGAVSAFRYNMGPVELAVDHAATGSALTLTRDYRFVRASYQFGSRQERSGFLGNAGSGALDLGTSNTHWNMIGLKLAITDAWAASMNYGRGHTAITNSALSMVQFQGPVRTETAQLGLVRRGLLLEQDRATIGVGYEPRVRHGQATVTAVTGYQYLDTVDGVVADPIVETEQVNLAQSRAGRLFLGYQTRLNNTAWITGSVAGNQQGHRIGVNFTWMQ